MASLTYSFSFLTDRPGLPIGIHRLLAKPKGRMLSQSERCGVNSLLRAHCLRRP
jgi:hypothetical protein